MALYPAQRWTANQAEQSAQFRENYERIYAYILARDAAHAAEVKEAMAGWADMIKRAAGMAERHAAEVAALRGALERGVALVDNEAPAIDLAEWGRAADLWILEAREALVSSPAAVDGKR